MKLARNLVFVCVAFAAIPCAAQTRPAHPGLHPVQAADGKWGFIDRAGRFRIPPRFDGAGEFSEGVAYVWSWDGPRRRNGIVDTAGRFTELPETNTGDVAFHDGLARFQTPSGQERKYGYMDKAGRVVVAPRFFDSGHFSEGLAWVAELREGKWLYGFIDRAGKVVIEPQFVYRPGDFAGGLAKAVGQTESGFIDRTGAFRLRVEYEGSDDSFSEGLLAAALPGGAGPRGVYLRPDGSVALEIPFWQQRTAHQRSIYTLRRQQLSPFREGLAAVLSFNRIGFMDKTGRVVIAPEFRETGGFSEGLAAVKIIGSDGEYAWGYIDRAGRFAVAPQFKAAGPFAGGLARVTTYGGGRQLIDARGRVVWRLSE